MSRLRTPWKNGVQPRGSFPRIRLSTQTSTSTTAARRISPPVTEREALACPKSTSQNPAWRCFWSEAEPRRPRPPSLTGWPASEGPLLFCLLKKSAFIFTSLSSFSYVKNGHYCQHRKLKLTLNRRHRKWPAGSHMTDYRKCFWRFQTERLGSDLLLHRHLFDSAGLVLKDCADRPKSCDSLTSDLRLWPCLCSSNAPMSSNLSVAVVKRGAPLIGSCCGERCGWWCGQVMWAWPRTYLSEKLLRSSKTCVWWWRTVVFGARLQDVFKLIVRKTSRRILRGRRLSSCFDSAVEDWVLFFEAL